MKFAVRHRLPFIRVKITHRGLTRTISNVLVDCGSASTIFQADAMARIGIVASPGDVIGTIWGVGGGESVFKRKVTLLQVGDRELRNWRIEVGGMDYGFRIDGIIGTDVLFRLGATLNFEKRILEFP